MKKNNRNSVQEIKEETNYAYLPKCIRNRLQTDGENINILNYHITEISENKINEKFAYNEIFKSNIYKQDESKLPIINSDNLLTYNLYTHGHKIQEIQKKPRKKERRHVEKVEIRNIIKAMVPRIDDIKELEKQIQMKHNILFEKLRPDKNLILFNREENDRSYKMPPKLYKNKYYLNHYVLNKENLSKPKVAVKKFEDSDLIYQDILDYNEFLDDIDFKLNFFPKEKLAENAFNFEDDFYGDIYYKIALNRPTLSTKNIVRDETLEDIKTEKNITLEEPNIKLIRNFHDKIESKEVYFIPTPNQYKNESDEVSPYIIDSMLKKNRKQKNTMKVNPKNGIYYQKNWSELKSNNLYRKVFPQNRIAKIKNINLSLF